jgi:hypothetical protein
MPELVKEIEVETVGELRKALATYPDCMPVYDAVGELLLLRVYRQGNQLQLEVA